MDTAHVIRLLEHPALPAQRTTSHFERGVTSTSHKFHALHQTLNGSRAICDERLSIIRLGGRFDAEDLDSCLACVVSTSH